MWKTIGEWIGIGVFFLVLCLMFDTKATIVWMADVYHTAVHAFQGE